MTRTSRSSAPDVTVLLVAEGEAFAEALATQLEALSVQVDLIASGENITDAFIVPPQLVVLSAATGPDGGASVLAQLAQRAATSTVAVAIIGDAASGVTRIDPLASPEQMAAQIATLASERRGSRARIPLPSPSAERSVIERSVIERPRSSPSPRAPLPSPARAPLPTSGAARVTPAPPSPASSSLPSSGAKPPPKPMTRPVAPFAKTMQLTAVRPSAPLPPSAAASAFASAPPAARVAPPPSPPPSPPPAMAAPPVAPGASPPIAAPVPIAESPIAAPPPAPPPAAPRARIRHATLVGLPSPVAVIARDAAHPATPLAATLVGHPSPALEPASIDHDLAIEADAVGDVDAPATVRPPAPEIAIDDPAPPIAGDATDLGIEMPELRGAGAASEPPIAGEPTDAGISIANDLASPSVETSDFAIAFEHQPAPEVPTGDVEVGTTELAAEPTPILRMAPYAASAPSHEHPAATPIPQRRSRWPLFAVAAVLLLAGAGGAGWYWMQRPIGPIASVPIAASLASTEVPPVPTPVGAPADPIAAPPVALEPVAVEAPVVATLEPAVAVDLAAPAAEPPAVPPAALGVHLPLGADEPIEGTEAEFDLVRLGVTPIIDPGGRRTTRRRIDRLLAQGYRARSRDRLDDSEEAYREVLALDPENARALVGLALVSADRDDDVNAVLYARRLVRLHPTYPANLVLLGERYAAGGDIASARRCFERALSFDRRHRGARAAMAALP
jgi:ActR/RegA family two-component response regulator